MPFALMTTLVRLVWTDALGSDDDLSSVVEKQLEAWKVNFYAENAFAHTIPGAVIDQQRARIRAEVYRHDEHEDV
jgi:hypothetical protein